MTIDARFGFYWILNFLKKGRGSSNFRKIRAIVRKRHTQIYYTHQGTLVLNLAKID